MVDDGSSDGSAEIARQRGVDLVVSHPLNLGSGAALRTGMDAAKQMDARAAVYVDADGEYPPEQIPRSAEAHRGRRGGLHSGFALPGHP